MKLRIGKPYCRENWNCAHTVADYYFQKYGVQIIESKGYEWDAQFLYYLRRHFEPSQKEEGCLLVCKTPVRNEIHVGVVIGSSVYHAAHPVTSKVGQTMLTPFFIFKQNYKSIRFYKWR